MFKHLKAVGATQTEAIVTLHLVRDVPLERVQPTVYSSEIWEYENLNDIAFQTFKYLEYDRFVTICERTLYLFFGEFNQASLHDVADMPIHDKALKGG